MQTIPQRHRRGDIIEITYHEADPPGQSKPTRHRIRIFGIWGSDVVGIETATGQWFATIWDPPKGETPGQRAKHHWRIQERHWRRWPRGLYSFGHAVDLALNGATHVFIPTFGELKRSCKGVNVELELMDGDAADGMEVLEEQLRGVEQRLKGKSPELQEAKDKLQFCVLVRGEKPVNGFQLCIVSARLWAVDRRFVERLGNIAGWMPKYAARAQLCQAARQAADRLLAEARLVVDKLLKPTYLDAPPRRKRALTALERLIGELARWQNIQPFVVWVGYTNADLRDAIEALKIADVSEARQRLCLVQNALTLKQLQPDLEAIVLELEHLILLKQFEDLPLVRLKLGEWQTRLKLITEDGWQRPVKQSVLTLLNQAFTDLDEGKHRLAANHLKQASWLI